MQGYAYTEECRRGYVLRYFSDPDAMESCDGCDNCLPPGRRMLPEAGPPRKGAAPRAAATVRRGAARVADAARGVGKGAGGRRHGNGSTAQPQDAEPLTGPAAERFEALRRLRTDIARSDEVPPYVVFHDRTLREMALRAPKDAASLATIPGVGPAKLDRYGARFLEMLQHLEA